MHDAFAVRPGIRLRYRQLELIDRGLISSDGKLKRHTLRWYQGTALVIFGICAIMIGATLGTVRPAHAVRPPPLHTEIGGTNPSLDLWWEHHLELIALRPTPDPTPIPEPVVIPPDPGGPVAIYPEAVKAAPATASGNPRVLGVPFFAQIYSLSCEEAALQMALAYHGVAMSQDQILAEIGVDRAHPSAGVNGGGNPWTSFVGNPQGSEVTGSGYGTYWPTIARVARSRTGIAAAGQGVSPGQLYSLVSQGHSAVVWVTFTWTYVGAWTYVTFDGQAAPYAGPIEHAVTVAGVSDGEILINDPDRGAYWVDKSVFEGAYATYGDMAVVL